MFPKRIENVQEVMVKYRAIDKVEIQKRSLVQPESEEEK